MQQFNNIVTDEKDLKVINDDQLVIICTGSQGEKRAGLNRVVNGNHRNLKLNSTDLVIFSSKKFLEMKNK